MAICFMCLQANTQTSKPSMSAAKLPKLRQSTLSFQRVRAPQLPRVPEETTVDRLPEFTHTILNTNVINSTPVASRPVNPNQATCVTRQPFAQFTKAGQAHTIPRLPQYTIVDTSVIARAPIATRVANHNVNPRPRAAIPVRLLNTSMVYSAPPPTSAMLSNTSFVHSTPKRANAINTNMSTTLNNSPKHARVIQRNVFPSTPKRQRMTLTGVAVDYPPSCSTTTLPSANMSPLKPTNTPGWHTLRVTAPTDVSEGQVQCLIPLLMDVNENNFSDFWNEMSLAAQAFRSKERAARLQQQAVPKNVNKHKDGSVEQRLRCMEIETDRAADISSQNAVLNVNKPQHRVNTKNSLHNQQMSDMHTPKKGSIKNEPVNMTMQKLTPVKNCSTLNPDTIDLSSESFDNNTGSTLERHTDRCEEDNDSIFNAFSAFESSDIGMAVDMSDVDCANAIQGQMYDNSTFIPLNASKYKFEVYYTLKRYKYKIV